MKRTNIMLTDNQHKKLKAFAVKEGKTLGELVREALNAVYEKKDALERKRAAALDAYREGFISLGRLSEILGLDAVSARLYLKEHGISIRVQDLHELKQDAMNA
jgi:predicted HTH domain antitoxin